MIRQYFPTQDASVFEEFSNRNTGMDEILEVGKNETGANAIRSILAFDFAGILAAVPTGSEFVLRLHTANAVRLPAAQTIQVGVYTGSWMEGTGYLYQDIYQVPNGIVWTDLSGSYTPTGSVTSSRPFRDVEINITSLINTAGITGLVLQFPVADEADIDNKGNIKFFSRDTHTIYAPVLEARWDAQIYATGSLSSSANLNIAVLPTSLRSTYKQNETVRVDVVARERYPLKTFANYLNPYQTSLYLPQTSYFSIVDEQTGFAVIPFSEYSKINQTATGAYFTFTVNNMYPRRFYKVVLKVVDATGAEQIFDDHFIFKVVD